MILAIGFVLFGHKFARGLRLAHRLNSRVYQQPFLIGLFTERWNVSKL